MASRPAQGGPTYLWVWGFLLIGMPALFVLVAALGWWL
jgi:hypothetical protein